MSRRDLLYVLCLCGSASTKPTNSFSSFSTFDRQAMFGSSSDFFDPSLNDLFPTSFGSDFYTDSGLGLQDYDSGIDFTIDGVCDDWCQEAQAQQKQFEQSVRNFDAQFGVQGSSFPATSGGSFPSAPDTPDTRTNPQTNGRARPTPSTARPTASSQPFTARPTANPPPKQTQFTAFPRVSKTKRPSRPIIPQQTTQEPARRRNNPVTRPPTTVVPSHRPAPTLRQRPLTTPTTRLAPNTPPREEPKAAVLPERTTGAPVVWSFNGESLGDKNRGQREGRTSNTESPLAPTPAGVLPIDDYFTPGDKGQGAGNGKGEDVNFKVFEAVPNPV